MLRPFVACVVVMSMAAPCRGDEPVVRGNPQVLPQKIATFSICAADPQTGVCGAAVASMYPDVGHVVPYARAGVGAFCTQHYSVTAWGERA